MDSGSRKAFAGMTENQDVGFLFHGDAGNRNTDLQRADGTPVLSKAEGSAAHIDASSHLSSSPPSMRLEHQERDIIRLVGGAAELQDIMKD
jgi:hypothetical protein